MGAVSLVYFICNLPRLHAAAGLWIGPKPVKNSPTGYNPDLCSVCSCTVTISPFCYFRVVSTLVCEVLHFFSRVIEFYVLMLSVAAVYSYVIACKYVTVCNFIFIAVDRRVNMCCDVSNVTLMFRIVL